VTQAPPAAAPRSRHAQLQYVAGIDGLRALSVLAVLVYHHYQLGATSPGWLRGGFLGVEVFFVVSGYLITSLLLDERRRTRGISLRNFWTRRGRRLLPALYLLLAVVILYALLFVDSAIETLKGDVVAALLYVSNWWQIAADRSYAANTQSPELLKHLWSLAIEEQFYLLWPLLLLVGLSKIGRARTALVMFLTLGASVFAAWLLFPDNDVVLPNRRIDALYFATPTRVSGLLLGALLAFVWSPRRLRGRTGPGARHVLNAAGVLGLVLLWWAFRSYNDYTDPRLYTRGGFLLVDLATVLVIAVTVHPRADWNRVLGLGPLVWIGLRSYGIYLWHYPVFAVTRPADIEHALGFEPPAMVWFAMRVAITLVLAELSFRFVEVPIRSGAISRYVERLRLEHGRQRRRLAAAGVMGVVAVSLVAVGLGSGLANAEPDEPKIGIENLAQEERKDPNAPDPCALEALRRSVSTTTTATTATTAVTGTTGAAGATAATAPTTTAPTNTTIAAGGQTTTTLDCPELVAIAPTTSSTETSTVAPGATTTPTVAPEITATTVPVVTTPPPPVTLPQVLGIGDSVMLGGRNALQQAIPGMIVDAAVSRQFAHAIAVLQTYKDYGLLPPVVVVHLGTNGRFGDGEFDHMMEVIGPDRQAFFLTARVGRPWEAEVNERLASGVSRHPNAHLVEWRVYSGCHDDWFTTDSFHLTTIGRREYASFVRAHVTGETGNLHYC
jgi:peptidoglycan/LPS O-acetylase OafA/YrhL